MKKIAKLLSKDGTGVLFCLIGIMIQGFHTYFIIYQGSNLTEGLKIWQSIMAALFFSFGLFYFLLKKAIANSENNKLDQMRFKDYITYFTTFEIFINEWYWARAKIYLAYKKREDLQLEWYETAEWYDWSILALFAFAIPLVLQAYADSIKLNFEEGDENKVDYKKEKEILDKYLPQITSIIDNDFIVTVKNQGTVKVHGTDIKEKRMILKLVKKEKTS